ncbi:salutaridinol 7-O-acetyltransferase-like [Papaver somniferum]|uniref:salutaridinol 7-O-acetyltransferase-like n=1 Tax=Papaver somniferum TaxID=3469 RepID=UPI000E6F6CCF|nr:salutaridinol 7-O-acetyltransferase-like [Papaver somniferum]
MKVQIISKEIIKPSTPTPPHLRNFKLSLLDQLLPPFYIPIVIFYPANDGHNNQRSKANILKKSLPETLTRFYPIAGRMGDNISIECNDESVDYIEAKVNAVMYDFMSVDVVHQIHPLHITVDVVAKEAQLAVQVKLFAWGGIAISICLSHKIADGCMVITFINSWVATAHVALNQEIVYPTFDSAAIFPALPPEVQVSSLESNDSIREENVVTKLFLFNASKISAVRARISASRSSNVLSKYSTRSEAISALVWKSFMETKSTIIVYNENPPGFSETLDGLISQLRLGVSMIDDEYIGKFQEGDVEFIKALEEASHHSNGENAEKVQICWISSLYSLPLYETDFGWGKPSWFVLNTFSEFKNSLFLVDAKCGAGIEAWVSLEEEDMVIFEKDQDILQYATLYTPFLRHGNTLEEPALSRL